MAGPGRITVLEHFPFPADTTVRLWNFKTSVTQVRDEHPGLLLPIVQDKILRPLDRPFVHITGMASRAGHPQANLNLSRNRANSVRALLASQGVPAARLGTFDFVGEERSNELLEENDDQERAVFIVITQNPRPPIPFPRPPLTEPREPVELRLQLPHSTLWSIKMDAAGSVERLLRHGRVARFVSKVLPNIRRLTRLRNALTADIAVFGIRD